MALVKEDGTVVTGANTYVDASDMTDFATARGLVVPTDTAELEVLLVRAMDFIESHGSSFKGYKTDPAQETQFPRTGVSLHGSTLDPNTIPKELKNAQCQAAYEAIEADLQPSTTEAPVRQETIGPITTIFGFTASDPWEGPTFPKIDAFLDPLLRGGGFGVPVCRA